MNSLWHSSAISLKIVAVGHASSPRLFKTGVWLHTPAPQMAGGPTGLCWNTDTRHPLKSRGGGFSTSNRSRSCSQWPPGGLNRSVLAEHHLSHSLDNHFFQWLYFFFVLSYQDVPLLEKNNINNRVLSDHTERPRLSQNCKWTRVIPRQQRPKGSFLGLFYLIG